MEKTKAFCIIENFLKLMFIKNQSLPVKKLAFLEVFFLSLSPQAQERNWIFINFPLATTYKSAQTSLHKHLCLHIDSLHLFLISHALWHFTFFDKGNKFCKLLKYWGSEHDFGTPLIFKKDGKFPRQPCSSHSFHHYCSPISLCVCDDLLCKSYL